MATVDNSSAEALAAPIPGTLIPVPIGPGGSGVVNDVVEKSQDLVQEAPEKIRDASITAGLWLLLVAAGVVLVVFGIRRIVTP